MIEPHGHQACHQYLIDRLLSGAHRHYRGRDVSSGAPRSHPSRGILRFSFIALVIALLLLPVAYPE
jgi:hypothetical protein